MKKASRYWVLPVLWALVIFSFSSLSQTPTNKIYWQDFIIKKLAHVLEYGILAMFLYRAMRMSGLGVQRSLWWSFVVSVLYGVSDEFHQSFTPGREPTVRDVVFDTIGALVSLWLIVNWLPKAPRRLVRLAKEFQLL